MAPLYRFSTEEEAFALANDTPYGLAAYLYAGDVGRVWRVSEALDYSMVGVNTGLMSTEVAPSVDTRIQASAGKGPTTGSTGTSRRGTSPSAASPKAASLG